jgi:CO/xanthine dehydrogenase FAD-binding subunit
VAVAGASSLPFMVDTTIDDSSAAVIDRLAAAIMEQAAPVGDYRGSVEYRRQMADVLARRALAAAFARGANA